VNGRDFRRLPVSRMRRIRGVMRSISAMVERMKSWSVSLLVVRLLGATDLRSLGGVFVSDSSVGGAGAVELACGARLLPSAVRLRLPLGKVLPCYSTS
jgi:hypothetical protein